MDLQRFLSVDSISIVFKSSRAVLRKGFLRFPNEKFQVASDPLSVLSMDFYSFHRHNCVQLGISPVLRAR